MFDKNQLRNEEQQLDRETSRLLIVERCSELFDTMDENNDGNVSRSELKSKLHKIVEFFDHESMDCFEEDLDTLMTILDFDKSGSVNKDEFCHGILQMAEGVRPLMIMETSMSVLYLKGKMEELFEALTKTNEDAAVERRHISNSLAELDFVVRRHFADQSTSSSKTPHATPWENLRDKASAMPGYMGPIKEEVGMSQEGRQPHARGQDPGVKDEVPAGMLS